MPPESSLVALVSTPSRWTSFRHSLTRAAISSSLMEVWRRSGNAMFSKTFIESKSAPSWNDMPNLRRIARHLIGSDWVRSSPSTMTCPRSGAIRPMMCFNRTLLPAPEPPTITNDSPRATSRLTPRRTSRPAKLFQRSMTAIVGNPGSSPAPFWLAGVVATVIPSEQDLREEEVGDQDRQRGHHDRTGRGAPDTLGATGGEETFGAAGDGEDEPEHSRLDQAGEHIVEVEVLEGLFPVHDGVGAQQTDRDRVAAEDAEAVGKRHEG